MKKIINLLSVMLLAYMLTGCIDRDVTEVKEGVSLPPVTDLQSSISNGEDIKVWWNIPANIPEEITKPVSVYVQVYKGTVLEHQIALDNNPNSWEYTLKDPDSSYRVVVKLLGWLKKKPYGMSDEIYSPGQTVSVN